MQTTIDPAQELEALARVLAECEQLCSQGPTTLEHRAPELSGWSVAQHLYHAALATGLSLRNVTSLVRDKGRLVQDEGQIGELAAKVLASETTERGVSEAPRMVTPPDDVNPEFLAMELDSVTKEVRRLAEDPEAIRKAPRWIPHQDLGPLDASAWTRFTHLHGKHHLDIVRDLLQA